MITIATKTLREVLGDIKDVVEKRNTIPVLSNVLMEAVNGRLAVTGTDLDIQMRRVVDLIEGDLMATFRITAHASTLSDIAKKLPDDSRTVLKVEDGKLIVTCGRSRFTLPTLPVDELPIMADFDADASFDVDAKAFAALLNRTKFAISSEEARYYLNGIYLHVFDAGDGPRLTAVATDGSRLACVHMAVPDGAEDLKGVILPRKTVGLMLKAIDENTETVSLRISSSRVSLSVGDDDLMISKLIDGIFPDYTRVIPTSNAKLLKVSPADLARAAERVTIVSGDKTRAVKFALERDLVTLSVSSPENGLAIEEVVAEYASEPVRIGLNARFLLDVLTHVPAVSIEMAFDTPASPVLVRAGADADARFVIMPIQI